MQVAIAVLLDHTKTKPDKLNVLHVLKALIKIRLVSQLPQLGSVDEITYFRFTTQATVLLVVCIEIDNNEAVSSNFKMVVTVGLAITAALS